jgi:hypothetical protein
MSERARAEAGALWNDAKDKARAVLDEQQKSAADGIGDFAGALRTAAGDLDSKNKGMAAHLGQQAADGLEHFAGALRNKDAATLIRELESFARREPAVFFGAAVAVGFLAVRFMKSSKDSAASHAYASSEEPAASHPPAPATATEGEVHGYDYNTR